MTNEEMIKDLGRIMDLLDMHIDLNQSLNITQMEVAYLSLKCIVKALEQQPCEDTISRADLNDAISELTYWHFEDGRLVAGGGGSKYETVYRVDDVVRMPAVLPSVALKRESENTLEQQQNRCDRCTHSEEQDGSNCYECVKGMVNNFEAQPSDEMKMMDEEIKNKFQRGLTLSVKESLYLFNKYIESLEQQPSEDVISREEAISRIEVRRKITCESDPYNYEEWTKGYEEGIDDAIAMINSVPSVTP